MDELEISRILVKKKWSTLSAEEQEKLEQWLVSSPQNKRIYETFISSQSWQERKKCLIGLDTAETIKKINMKLAKAHRIKQRRKFTQAVAVAATIILACFSIIFLTKDVPKNEIQIVQSDTLHQSEKYYALLTVDHGEKVVLKNQETEWKQHLSDTPAEIKKHNIRNIRIEVPKGKNYKLRLSDSTLVWLNTETVIEYPEQFTGDKRSVFLSGEAFFEVATNRSKPFEIKNRDSILIQVTGTQLNVSDYEDEALIKITLLEGVVQVETKTLAPRQQAIIHKEKGEMEIKEIQDASTAIAWINGMFAFESESFSTVMETLAKYHQLKVVYRNPEKLPQGHLTFHASYNDSIEQLLEQLQMLIYFDYQITGDQLHIQF